MISQRTVKDLEFDRVLDLVRAYSLSDVGRNAISVDRVTSDTAVLEARADRISSILGKIVNEGSQLSPFVPIDALVTQDAGRGLVHDGADLLAYASFVSSFEELSRFEDNPGLCADGMIQLAREIAAGLEGDGSVRDSHPLVRPLFRALEAERSRRAAYAQECIISNSQLYQSGQAVYRNERVVLPVRREKRGLVSGYVQGSSASGGTLYVEPFELVELNNNVTLAEDEIRRVKYQIISGFSHRVDSFRDELRSMLSYLADFDFHYSFAMFIHRTKSQRTVFSDTIRLVGARHPLLFEKAVPISLTVPPQCRVVVLSGANAGGKTVTMKTVALFALLSQICAHAPFEEGSSLPVFSSFFTDIGDGQSILENFSTFSGHMANVAEICRNSDAGSLVLLDELGSGTDPAEGAALVDSLLDYFKDKGSMLFVTSHYSQVKLHAYGDSGMLNASMEFDEGTDRPTFRVIEGLPGDSHAIAIAKRMGLPAKVVASARASLDPASSVSQMISNLNGRLRALDRKVTELTLEKKRYEKMESELALRQKELDELRLRYEEGSADELRRWMKETRRRLENLVRDVSTGALDSRKTHAVKSFIRELEDKSRETDESVSAQKARMKGPDEVSFKEGDEVLCGSFGRRGIILRDLGKGRYQVSLDSMKMTLSSDDLRPAPAEKKATVSPFSVSTPRPSLTLDLRGRTLAEAVAAIDDEIESCLVHSLSSFSIIHGYGNGILSQGIHSYLSKRKEVKDYYFANPEDGGMGKTYVMLG